MEERKISHKPQLSWKVASNIGMVNINTSNNTQVGIIKSRSTEDTIIGTHIGTNPIASCVKRVRVHSIFPCLKSNVSSPEPRIGKGYNKINLIFKVIGEITIFRERQELTPGDEGRLSIRKSQREG